MRPYYRLVWPRKGDPEDMEPEMRLCRPTPAEAIAHPEPDFMDTVRRLRRLTQGERQALLETLPPELRELHPSAARTHTLWLALLLRVGSVAGNDSYEAVLFRNTHTELARHILGTHSWDDAALERPDEALEDLPPLEWFYPHPTRVQCFETLPLVTDALLYVPFLTKREPDLPFLQLLTALLPRMCQGRDRDSVVIELLRRHPALRRWAQLTLQVGMAGVLPGAHYRASFLDTLRLYAHAPELQWMETHRDATRTLLREQLLLQLDLSPALRDFLVYEIGMWADWAAGVRVQADAVRVGACRPHDPLPAPAPPGARGGATASPHILYRPDTLDFVEVMCKALKRPGVRQDDSDPQLRRYVLGLAPGSDVPLGDMRTLGLSLAGARTLLRVHEMYQAGAHHNPMTAHLAEHLAPPDAAFLSALFGLLRCQYAVRVVHVSSAALVEQQLAALRKRYPSAGPAAGKLILSLRSRTIKSYVAFGAHYNSHGNSVVYYDYFADAYSDDGGGEGDGDFLVQVPIVGRIVDLSAQSFRIADMWKQTKKGSSSKRRIVQRVFLAPCCASLVEFDPGCFYGDTYQCRHCTTRPLTCDVCDRVFPPARCDTLELFEPKRMQHVPCVVCHDCAKHMKWMRHFNRNQCTREQFVTRLKNLSDKQAHER